MHAYTYRTIHRDGMPEGHEYRPGYIAAAMTADGILIDEAFGPTEAEARLALADLLGRLMPATCVDCGCGILVRNGIGTPICADCARTRLDTPIYRSVVAELSVPVTV